jgi:hypothetical protein
VGEGGGPRGEAADGRSSPSALEASGRRPTWPHTTPRSLRETHAFVASPVMMWSRTSNPRSEPAAARRRVRARSSAEGAGSPEGWLWVRTSPLASCSPARAAGRLADRWKRAAGPGPQRRQGCRPPTPAPGLARRAGRGAESVLLLEVAPVCSGVAEKQRPEVHAQLECSRRTQMCSFRVALAQRPKPLVWTSQERQHTTGCQP